MAEKKTIDRDTYLKALGLFTLARAYAAKADEASDALEAVLGVPEEDLRSSHFFDAVYGNSNSLDEALKKADYEVDGGYGPKI